VEFVSKPIKYARDNDAKEKHQRPSIPQEHLRG
jgi:hypothetical protein